MADSWEEVKRLASDFQKAQLSSTLQRLSERNCVEIVTKLIEEKLLDVIFTTDGKEYITPQQLIREIKDELYVRGGRTSAVDLAKELSVDLNQINYSISEITKSSRDVHLVLGQLIDSSYVAKIGREINERLAQYGQTNVGDLSMQYDLPADFLLHSVLEKQLGKIIHAKQDSNDPRIFFTEAFIAQSKAKVKGALIGITKPTPVSIILNQCNITERLFHSLFDQVAKSGTVTGRQAGALFIPHSFTKSQIQWVTNFYKQNGYVEFDAIQRLGISDPKTFIVKQLPNEKLFFLQSCAVGLLVIDQLETALEECVAARSFLDVTSVVPTVFSDKDIELLLEKVFTLNIQKSVMLFGSMVISNHYLDKLSEICAVVANEKAKIAVESGIYQQYYAEKQSTGLKNNPSATAHVDVKTERREERRKKAAGGKGGGGTQGRETKTKSTKKHIRNKTGQDSDSDDTGEIFNKKSTTNFHLMSLDDIQCTLEHTLEQEGMYDIISDICKYLYPNINKAALSNAHTLFEETLVTSTQNRKQTHSAVQDKLNVLINDVKLYEKGIKHFAADQQTQFVKYLLKTHGNDIAIEFFKYIANECNLQYPTDMTIEQRNKLINDVKENFKNCLLNLTKSLSGQSIEDFLQAADECLQECGMILKKADKKKDRALILNHRYGLIDQLSSCHDPALVLHISALAIFTTATQTMLQASGRQISVILTFLKPFLNEQLQNQLRDFHDLVLQLLNAEEQSHQWLEAQKELVSKIDSIKTIASDYKKPSTSQAAGVD